jgi:hypothetical protein
MHGIDSAEESHQHFHPPAQLAALQEHLSDAEIEMICRQLGHKWRDRNLPPGVTVRSLVYRSLNPDKSIKATLADLAAADLADAFDVTDSAWCQARSRLPEELLDTLIRRSDKRLADLAGREYSCWGRTVFLADGSTVSTEDTPDLVEAFGYADTKHGPSRFPVARMTFLVRAGAKSVFSYRIGPYRTSEEAQFSQMSDRIPRHSILIADRKFGSFYILAKLRQRRVDMIVPLHQRRDPGKLISRGKAIGKDQWIVTLDLAQQLRNKYDDPSLPQYLKVRLIRVQYRKNGTWKTLWLVTTLLDTQRYRRRDIVALYRKRWGIETRIGAIKTTLEMAVLRSKGAKAVRYEVAATILAHNLTWTVIHQAAKRTKTPADRISFAGAIKAVLAFSSRLQAAEGSARVRLYNRMLDHVATNTNPHRPGRVEPRLVKRDRRRYGFLKIPRQQAREALS